MTAVCGPLVRSVSILVLGLVSVAGAGDARGQVVYSGVPVAYRTTVVRPRVTTYYRAPAAVRYVGPAPVVRYVTPAPVVRYARPALVYSAPVAATNYGYGYGRYPSVLTYQFPGATPYDHYRYAIENGLDPNWATRNGNRLYKPWEY